MRNYLEKIKIMKKLITLFSFLVLIISCQKDNETKPLDINHDWQPIFTEITEEILDFKVNGEELHLITDKIFYRIKGENIIEQRELECSNYLNYSEPQIGDQLIFRLLNFDTIVFLEFQPIAEGGSPTRVNLQDLGMDNLTFPTTHGLGTLNVGRFHDQNNFLFTGHDYPSGQQFINEIKIQYNEVSNIIENIEIQDRIDISPISSITNFRAGIDNVFGVENISFINAGYGGTYRFQDGDIQHFENINLKSCLIDEQEFYGTLDLGGRQISKSTDMGLTWFETGVSLALGDIIYKKGDYLIATNKWDQIFSIGKSIQEMETFDAPQFDQDNVLSLVEFYNEKYLLIGYIDGKNQIFTREQLN